MQAGGVSETVLNKYLKPQIKKLSSFNSDKNLLNYLNRFLIELTKKLSNQKSSSQIDSKINSLKEMVSQNGTYIQLYNSQMVELREEVEDLLIKEKNMKSEMKDILKRIDMKELKGLRNDHKLKALLK